MCIFFVSQYVFCKLICLDIMQMMNTVPHFGYLICFNSPESKMFHVKNSVKLNNKLIKILAAAAAPGWDFSKTIVWVVNVHFSNVLPFLYYLFSFSSNFFFLLCLGPFFFGLLYDINVFVLDDCNPFVHGIFDHQRQQQPKKKFTIFPM